MAPCLETNYPNPTPINKDNIDTPITSNPSVVRSNSNRKCVFTHPLYQAGPERGNKNGAIGGTLFE